MTLEKLLECNASELEKMSNEELLKYFEPYLKFTRPELAVKPAIKNAAKFGKHESKSEKERLAMQIASQFGIELNL